MPISQKSLHVMLHLFLVYISWGSTYIGYKFSLGVAGPFLVGGSRMVIGGILLALFLMLTGRWIRPERKDWIHATWMGVFMVLLASGFLAKGQESVASSTAAVITGSTPITMLVAGWLFANEPRPRLLQWTGLATGTCGLVLLAYSQQNVGGVQQSSISGMIWVFTATLGWVAGTLLTRRFPFKTRLSSLQSCALLIFMGGLECLVVAFLDGEHHAIRYENIHWPVVVAFAWMCTGGSVIAYACYFWLLENVPIATAISYEYVVPVIGIFLGWLVERSGSILPGMLLHFINNTLAFLSLYLRQYAPEQLAVVYELILLVALPLAALFLVWRVKAQGFSFSAGLRGGMEPLAVFTSLPYTVCVLFLMGLTVYLYRVG